MYNEYAPPRQKYETFADRMREDEVLEVLSSLTNNFSFCKDVEFSCNDFRIYAADTKEIYALGEIKIRNNSSQKYPDYMISRAKLLNCLAKADDLGVHVSLFVRFTDGLFCTKVKPDLPYPSRLAGRYDRQDSRDMEMCVFIPIAEFEFLCPM